MAAASPDRDPGLPERSWAVLELLAEGEPVSGQAVSEALGISRQAVWKHVQLLRQSGLEVNVAEGQGYVLMTPIRLLDAASIGGTIAATNSAPEPEITVLKSTASTNDWLSEREKTGQSQLVVAEYQTRGRGRRGRHWFSPPGCNLYLSVSWCFEGGLAGLGGLSLVVGIAVAAALQRAGVADLWLKWPNDIYRGHGQQAGKLGGILVDISGEASGPCEAVIGLGLNVQMPPSTALDRPWSDLSDTGLLDRNYLAGVIYARMHQHLEVFEQGGFDEFVHRWNELDGLRHKPITVYRPNGPVNATAKGVSHDGGLRIETDGTEQVIHADEVSIRAG